MCKMYLSDVKNCKIYLSKLQNVCAVVPACDGDWCRRGCNGKGNLMYPPPMYSAMKCGLLGCNVMANGFWPSPSRGWKIIRIPPPHGHYLKLSIEVMVPDIRGLMESEYFCQSLRSSAAATWEQLKKQEWALRAQCLGTDKSTAFPQYWKLGYG